MKYSVCNEMFEGWQIQDVFKVASELGFNGVEISPFTLSDSVLEISSAQRERIRGLAKSYGIEIVGLHWLLVKPTGLYINHPDEGIRQRTLAYFKDLISFCSDLGGKIMVFGSPKQRDVVDKESYEETWRRTKDFFLRCLPKAEDEGITICFEPLAPTETNFINTVDEAIKLIEEVGHPNFKLILDVKAMSSEGRPLKEIIMRGAKYLRHFHANDDNGKTPGWGKADYKGISEALKDVGYDGFLSIEVFDFKPDPVIIARSGLEYLKNFFG